MRTLRTLTIFAIAAFAAQASSAQLGNVIRKAQDNAQKAKKVANIYTPWTAEQELAIGQASAAKLINIFGLYENADMTRYVNLVGNTVARQAPRNTPYHFAILDTEVITAVSLPGGFVFITRGALANLHNEAELAGVLAHEVAHVDQRHLEKEIRAQKSSQFAKEEAVTRVPTGYELSNLAGDVVTKSLTLQVSRDKENEADRLGLDFASKAGYDPSGLRNFLQFLADAPATPESNRQLGLWGSTHPPLRDRINSLNTLMASHPAGGQQLAERYAWNVNPVAFSHTGAAASSSAAEVDGVVSQGVVVLSGAKLPEGARVKVRVQP